MTSFEHSPRTSLIFGLGAIHQAGHAAASLGFRRALLVADHGISRAGHITTVLASLAGQGIECSPWSEFDANPDSNMVAHGAEFAVKFGADSIIGLGGGSSMDCAKGINFVVTNGGAIQDYWGYGKATKPMLPMIGIPATTGTGSEAQSYALISDAKTHVKMAIGDPKAAFATAILDPEVALTQPTSVRALAGYDAISHAVESFVSTKRNGLSSCYSREAWRLLNRSFDRVLHSTSDVDAVADMQLGSWFAGCAIEASMLGAAHALANPLTARHGTAHGHAIAAMLPHVVRWNGQPDYSELHPALADRLADLAAMLHLPLRLSALGISQDELPPLADDAAMQWTGRFNPRPFDAASALELYQCAY